MRDPDIDPLHQPAAVARLEGEHGGLGGKIKVEPEDFRVEEIPLVRPTGRGEFAYIQIEKRETSTFDALLFLSKAAKVSERRIGYAGLKDSRAVTTQYMTLPKVPPERVANLVQARMRVLTATRHESPLRIGHLKGNRFTIRIRDVDPARIPHARRVLERLVARGMPNAYGEQRFGVRWDGHLLGRAMVLGDWERLMGHLLGEPSPRERSQRIRSAREAYDRGDLEAARQIFPMRHRTEKKALSTLARGGSPKEAFEQVASGPRRIWLSAWQSYIFNRVLDQRVREGTYDRLLEGDIAWLHGSGASFPVRDAAAEAPRAASGAASPTGPLAGYDLRQPTGEPLRIEHALMEQEGVDLESFRAPHCRARGLRRALRIPIKEASLEAEGPTDVVVRFVLPPGAYATVLLDHLMG